MDSQIVVIKKMDYLCKQTFFFGQRERFIKGKTYKGIPYKDDRTGEHRVEMYLRGTDFVYGFGEENVYFDVFESSESLNDTDDSAALFEVETEQISLDF